jgi:hypothetical protein
MPQHGSGHRPPAIRRGLGLLHGRSKGNHLDPITVVKLLLQFGEPAGRAHEPLGQNGIRDGLVTAVPS